MLPDENASVYYEYRTILSVLHCVVRLSWDRRYSPSTLSSARSLRTPHGMGRAGERARVRSQVQNVPALEVEQTGSGVAQLEVGPYVIVILYIQFV